MTFISSFTFPQGTWLDQSQAPYSTLELTQGWVIIYSYPKDHTPGCTRQACILRDMWSKWADLSVTLFGLSADSIDSHHTFATQNQLPFPLLSDPELILCKALGIWGEQQWKEHRYMGLERSTWIFLNGQIKASFRHVHIDGHWDEVWEKWNELASSLDID